MSDVTLIIRLRLSSAVIRTSESESLHICKSDSIAKLKSMTLTPPVFSPGDEQKVSAVVTHRDIFSLRLKFDRNDGYK